MKERGILFTPENYTKCENGTKTQTRRIMKPQPPAAATKVEWNVPGAGFVPWYWIDGSSYVGGERLSKPIKCPFGTVGDRLYVKEGLEKRVGYNIQYRRDKKHLSPYAWQWQRPTLSPLHMPKWAARLWLEITDVRVERLHDISETDAKAEGCQVPDIMWPDSPLEAHSYIEQFKCLWESNKIHKPGSWELNPWVWVLSYRKVTT